MAIALRIHRHRRAAAVLEKEWLARFWRGTDFIHGRGFIKTAIHHHVRDAVRLANVFEHIAIDDREIRELARFQRADVFIQE